MKLKPFEPKALYPIRSPDENALRIDSHASHDYDWINDKYLEALKGAEEEPERQRMIAEQIPFCLERILVNMHGRGDPIEDIADRVVEFITFIEDMRETYPYVNLVQEGLSMNSFGVVAICMLLAPDQEYLKRFGDLIQIKDSDRFYPADVLLKAFLPDWQIAKKYPKPLWTKLAWVRPLTTALASTNKEKELIKFMEKYESYIKVYRPFKWTKWTNFKVNNDVDGNPKYGNAFHLFAFEVAVTVCAYDLDDSAFRDHPRYPRELVDYYRKNIRLTRDAGRANGVGADIVVQPPAKPKKNDLRKSRSKNFKRWIELVCDGEAETCKSVISVYGNTKRVVKHIKLFEELGDNRAAICVDVKDDESLENSLEALMESREIVGYEPPETKYTGGPGRCEGILKHAANWLGDSQYALYVVDLRSDNWGAVIVHNDFADEFKILSKQLNVDLS